jgi:uncharacterized protein YeaC (DUF1315 family)
MQQPIRQITQTPTRNVRAQNQPLQQQTVSVVSSISSKQKQELEKKLLSPPLPQRTSQQTQSIIGSSTLSTTSTTTSVTLPNTGNIPQGANLSAAQKEAYLNLVKLKQIKSGIII